VNQVGVGSAFGQFQSCERFACNQFAIISLDQCFGFGSIKAACGFVLVAVVVVVVVVIVVVIVVVWPTTIGDATAVVGSLTSSIDLINLVIGET
jgi:hypothetical protein